MILDYLLTCSNAQSVVGDADTAILSEHSILVSRDIGTGRSIKAVVNVDTAVVGGSGGFKVDLIESDAAVLSSPNILASVTADAEPAAGTELMDMVIPANAKVYLGFQFTPITSAATAGKVNAALVLDTPHNPPKPDGL